LPKIPPLLAKIQKEKGQFKKTIEEFRPRFEWVGILTKKDRNWDCAMKSSFTDTDSGELLILRQNPNNTVRPVAF